MTIDVWYKELLATSISDDEEAAFCVITLDGVEVASHDKKETAIAIFNAAMRYVRRGASEHAALRAAKIEVYNAARRDPLCEPFINEYGETDRIDNARMQRDFFSITDVELGSLKLERLRGMRELVFDEE